MHYGSDLTAVAIAERQKDTAFIMKEQRLAAEEQDKLSKGAKDKTTTEDGKADQKPE